MPKEKIIHIPDIGQVTLRKHKGARKFTLSLETDNTLKMSMPYWISFVSAENIILSNKPWVHKYREKMDKFFKRQRAVLARAECVAERIDPAESADKIIGRLYELAAQYGYSFNKVTVRDMKSRWGSCTAKNNITLNKKLIKLPGHLMDYVILHELVHLKVKNHGSGFWQALSRHLIGPKLIDKELRCYCPAML